MQNIFATKKCCTSNVALFVTSASNYVIFYGANMQKFRWNLLHNNVKLGIFWWTRPFLRNILVKNSLIEMVIYLQDKYRAVNSCSGIWRRKPWNKIMGVWLLCCNVILPLNACIFLDRSNLEKIPRYVHHVQ